MSNNKSLAGVFVVLALVLGGLVYVLVRRSGKPAEVPGQSPLPRSGVVSPTIDIDVYVDGSGSMKNFLAGTAPADGENYLHEFLTKSESTFGSPATSGGWADPKVRFWKFGAGLTPLPAAGDLRKLSDNPAGFNAGNTSIDVPVNDHPQERLHTHDPEVKVIVTDLYQSDQAPEQIAKGLAQQYLTGAGAVAVYGLRSPYSGPVEDLPGMQGRSLAKGAADTMPFYIILAGDKAADVYHAEEALMQGATGSVLRDAFARKQAFAEYFSKDPGTTGGKDLEVSWFASASAPRRKTGAGDVAANYNGSGVGGVLLRDGIVKVDLSQATTGPGAVPHEVAMGDGSELRVTASAVQKDGSSREDRDAEKAVTAELTAGDAGGGRQAGAANGVSVIVDRAGLAGKTTYLYQVDVIATARGDELRPDSTLMRRWNIEDPEVASIAHGDGRFPADPTTGSQHAGRTPHLSQFLTQLQGQMFQVKDVKSDPVRVATYYFYVQTR